MPPAVRRLPERDATWHLPSELRALVIAILDCRLPVEARDTLRFAKSIELLPRIGAQLWQDRDPEA